MTVRDVNLSSGAFHGGEWPPYTSHIAFELFKQSIGAQAHAILPQKHEISSQTTFSNVPPAGKGWFASLFGGSNADENSGKNESIGIARQRVQELTESDRSKLDGYFVRIRYNDKIMSIPGCKQTGKHLDDDESFCTLVSDLLPTI